MSGSELIVFLTSLSAAAAGLVLLYLAWKRHVGGALIVIGWALMAISAILAVMANADRGFAQIAVIAMLGVSLLFIFMLSRGMPALDFAKQRRVANESQTSTEITILSVLRDMWTFLLTGPIAGIIALFAAAGLFRVLRPAEGNPATAGVSVIIAAVVLWGLVSTLLLNEARPLRRTIYAMAGIALTSAAAFI